MKKALRKLTALALAVLLLFSATAIVSAADDLTAAGDEIKIEKIDFQNPDFIKGMDVSSVIALENSGVQYYDENGTKDLFEILSENGVNYIRVRVWNNPYNEDDQGYGGGNCDVKTAAEIGARAAKYGMKLMVDFHYSDFWADPSKQLVPKAWANMDIDEKTTVLGRFTASSLETIKNAGADIGMVQIGNEINNGMAGENEFMKTAQLINAGAKAVRDFDENIRVAVHFTDIQDVNAFEWNADALAVNEVDYDVFAVSYYPYWHGSLSNLTSELDKIAKTYKKEVMVAETSYPYTLSDSDGYGNTVSEGCNDTGDNMLWEFSAQGQAQEVRDVMAAVNDVEDGKGIGVFYWEGAWITVGDTTGLTDNEYGARVGENQELWERYGSGWASSYSVDYASTTTVAQFGGCAVDNQAFFDPSGKALPSLKVFSLVSGSDEPTEPTSEDTEPTSEVTEPSSSSETESTSEVTEPSSSSETEPTSEITEPSSSSETEPSSSSDTEPTSEVTEPTASSETQPTKPTEYHDPVLKTSSVTLKAGATARIVVLYSNNQEITYRCYNTNAVIVDNNGLVSALKTGQTKIVVTVGKKKLIYNVKVTNGPTIKIGSKDFKKSTEYNIQKGKTLTVNITGKAAAVNNVYKSSNKKVAVVDSAATASSVKIKGLKQGTATVTIKVNGVEFPIKVKVNAYIRYVLGGMEVGSVQADGSILYKVQKSAALNGRALSRLVEGSAKRKIVIPAKTVKIERVLHIGNNKTIIAKGATILQVNKKIPIMLNDCKKTNYGSLKNFTIDGGIWQIQDNAKANYVTSTFRFAHAQNITIKNARVDTNYICHAIELIACKNVKIYNCKLEAKGKQKNDKYAEPLQIDIATKQTAPAIASQGKKYVNGQICQNITVEKCTVKGSRGICTNKTDSEGGKWLSRHHVNVKIIGCTVTGMKTEALCLHNVMGVTVQNTKAYSKGGDYNYNNGCFFASFGNNGQTAKYSNVFSGNTFKGGKHGLYIQTYAGNKHGKTTVTKNNLYAKAGKGAALSVANCKKVISKGNKLYKW
ncbi:MAG: glycosyl hydrolase 53 family protein [Ruminococcus sp.]|nr:glycosyl hydrolase 53 family protein [Ruminococcus sp.]